MPDQETETIQSQDGTNMWSICNTGKSYINTITSGHKWKKKSMDTNSMSFTETIWNSDRCTIGHILHRRICSFFHILLHKYQNVIT